MVFRACMGALPNFSFIAEAIAAATRIFKTIELIPIIDTENGKGKVLGDIKGQIEFKDVDFSYPSRPTTLILQGFCLKVKPGKTVGLVGGSGSGKSTIISLLERFYDPIRGDILLDGYKIKKLQLKWLRSQMGLVNQEPVLFATSVKENILFGKEGATMEMIETAAKAANAHDFIVKLPDGYETQVSFFFLVVFCDSRKSNHSCVNFFRLDSLELNCPEDKGKELPLLGLYLKIQKSFYLMKQQVLWIQNQRE